MQAIFFVLLILSLTASSSAFLERLTNLFSSKKDLCPIKLYDPKDPSFTGVKLYTNADTFHPLLRTLSTYAKDCRVKINIKQAFIQENPGLTTLKIQDHNEMSFRLGEAIEFELVDQDKKLLCNRMCLDKDLSQLRGLPDAKCFLEKLAQNSDLRQDALKRNLLIRRPKLHEPLVKLEERRKDIQNKCSKLKMDS
jgi:hypothetical protein